MTNRRRKMLMIAPLAILAMAGFVFAVMSLWNWLIPAIFGGKLITYWQALGILVLSRILVGGLGGGHGGGRRKMVAGWNQLSPEEQEKFRAAMKARGCGPAPEPQA